MATPLEQLNRMVVPKAAKADDRLRPLRIIVADRGWVFVGECFDNADGSVTIRNARNIRRWGTDAGLGQLIDGPRKETVCDDYGIVRCTPVVQIAVNGGW